MKINKFNLNRLIRPSVKNLQPYCSARDEFKGKKEKDLFFDANENPFSNGYNRYPDPQQTLLKKKLSELKKVASNQILLGNGSDEVLDILLRTFCEPYKDNIILTSPTYGMYEVLAHINEVQIKTVKLQKNFQLPVSLINEYQDENSKLLFLCSPNNPTGNNFKPDAIEELLNSFKGIVILDEAYIDFSTSPSWIERLSEFQNLVVVQTFSKAYGNAGIRLGACYGSSEIIGLLNKIKAPYNVSELTQQKAMEVLLENEKIQEQVSIIIKERKKLAKALKEIQFVETIYPSEGNFLLIKVDDASKRYQEFKEKGIVVRNRSLVDLCENCLRISIGTPAENKILMHVANKLL